MDRNIFDKKKFIPYCIQKGEKYRSKYIWKERKSEIQKIRSAAAPCNASRIASRK